MKEEKNTFACCMETLWLGERDTLIRQPGALELVLVIMMDKLLNARTPQFLCFLLPLGMQES